MLPGLFPYSQLILEASVGIPHPPGTLIYH